MLDTPRANLPIGTATTRWSQRHLLDVDQLDRDAITRCLDLAVEMRSLRERGERLDELAGHAIGLAFAEPSTRTRVSFEIAATALGAQVLALPMEASSTTKGESLVDTLLTLERTGIDTIVLRHGASGAPYLAARATGLRIVNAGDGTHAHPTQALLDALTLRDALGGLDGAVIAIVGDIGHSRVARSNLHLLARMGATVRAGRAARLDARIRRLSGSRGAPRAGNRAGRGRRGDGAARPAGARRGRRRAQPARVHAALGP